MTAPLPGPPVVSVLMPTFNRLEYLPPAIESVLSQTLQSWELLIADDGSDEPTRAYLHSLTDPRIRVICLPHSGRPSAVTNAALRQARGEYIAFLDSDDLWRPEKLSRQVASLRERPQRGWSYTGFVLIDGAGQPLGGGRARRWPAPSGWILGPLLREETVIAQPSVLVARVLLQQTGGFDERLQMCYDDELWFRLAELSEIDGIDEPLTVVRRHGLHSGSDEIAWRDRRRVFEALLSRRGTGDLGPLLRRSRARMSIGLAKSLAVSGRASAAIRTLLRSTPHTWRYPGLWAEALLAMGRVYAPAFVLNRVRRYRQRQKVHGT